MSILPSASAGHRVSNPYEQAAWRLRRHHAVLTLVLILLWFAQPVLSQNAVYDHFDGNELSPIWTQIGGDTSNFSIVESELVVHSTLGGVNEGSWRYVHFRTDFNADSSFYVSLSFDYNRLDYKQLKVSLLDSSLNTVVQFLIWDAPGDWILLGPSCYTEIRTSYVPVEIEIYRTNGQVIIEWDEVVRYQCFVEDTVAYLQLSFGDWDGSETPDIADLIHLVTYMFQDGPAPAACE
jgi:hypothetical protein